MRRFVVVVLALTAVAAACSEQAQTPAEPLAFAELQFTASSAHGHTHLSGREEVPPVPTRAQGQFQIRQSKDGESLYFKLIVANITNVTQAHIHLGPAGVNGPVIVWLYPSGPPPQLIPGRTQGVLAEGVITEASLVGLLAGGTLDDLLAAMRAGNTYVNVHTEQFPGGEVRGQIRMTK